MSGLTRRPTRCGWITAGVSLCVLCYCLSIGPVAWAKVHGYLPGGAGTAVVDAMIAPVNCVCDRSQVFGRLRQRYLYVWRFELSSPEAVDAWHDSDD